jgi:glycosyltransferase involved in cell wall biosynthesis
VTVAPNDPGAMADALLQLACEPERALRMGAAGREAVERRFSLQAMVAAYQGLYETKLGAAAAARRA